MDLKTAINTNHIVWAVGEPLVGVLEAQRALLSLTGKPAKIWTAGTGLGDRWGEEYSDKKTPVKSLVETDRELIQGILEATTPKNKNSKDILPGLIIVAEGIKFGAHIIQTAMKAVSEDGKLVFVSSSEPPLEFLPNYRRVYYLTYGSTEEDLKSMCEKNGRAYNPKMSELLLGLSPYQQGTVLAESFATSAPGDELDYITSRRGEAIRQDSLDIVTLLEPTKSFDDLIGLDRAKKLLLALAMRDLRKPVKGVLLVGLPGVGKTKLAEALAKEVGLPAYNVDVGSVFGMYVGETQARTRRGIQVLSNAPPGIVIFDEVEKAMSGVDSRNSQNSNHTAVQAGMYFLKYLNDPVANGGTYHLIIGTSNDVFGLPPEFTRAGRWNAVFAFMLPKEEQLRRVLHMYRGIHSLDEAFGEGVDLRGMTPADVEAVCQIGAIIKEAHERNPKSLPEATWDNAAKYVPVLTKFRPDEVEKVEKELEGRAVLADDDELVDAFVSEKKIKGRIRR